MDLGLSGASCIVTGGSRGIGRATAEALLREGASVAVVSRRRPSVEAAVAALAPLGTVHGFACDVADEDAVAATIALARERLGGLDVLVANAGIAGTQAVMADMTTSVWDEVMHINLRGAFVCCREAAQRMRMDAVAGRIVIVSSATVFQAEPRLGHYNTAKAGLIGLTRSLAVDLAASGIRVNCVAPGLTDTDQTQGYITPGMTIGAMHRAGTPAEIAAAITFLAGDACGFVTGATLVVDGGQAIAGIDGPE